MYMGEVLQTPNLQFNFESFSNETRFFNAQRQAIPLRLSVSYTAYIYIGFIF